MYLGLSATCVCGVRVLIRMLEREGGRGRGGGGGREGGREREREREREKGGVSFNRGWCGGEKEMGGAQLQGGGVKETKGEDEEIPRREEGEEAK